MRRHSILPAILFFIGSLALQAQTVISPYTNAGLGELQHTGLPHNVAMGEIGIGTPSVWHINNQNPSFLVNNTLSTFQVGFQGDFRNFQSNTAEASDAAGSLRYMAVAFPIKAGKWSTSISLLPYSIVNYNLFNTQQITDSVRSVNKYLGSGGLSQVNWSHGFRLYKNLLVGVSLKYVFGSISNEVQNFLDGPQGFISPYIIEYSEETSYSDVTYSVGVSNRFALSKSKFLNVGAIFELSGTLKGDRNVTFSRLAATTGGILQTSDVLADGSVEFVLPREMGFGVSYEYANKYLIGLDMTMRNWGTETEEGVTLNNAFKIALGGEITPDYQNVRRYWSRVNYRFGLNYRQLSYLVNETKINDFGINFGASFPVNSVSSVDTGFKFGWRGTTDNDLIRERYIQVVFGITINDRWFVKRRYD